MTESCTETTRLLIEEIENGVMDAEIGYLVGLDRPALLAPDRAALLASQRHEDVLARGHRWRVVNEALWTDLLDLGRERPVQRVYVIQLSAVDQWLEATGSVAELEEDGWRGDQGTTWIIPMMHTMQPEE